MPVRGVDLVEMGVHLRQHFPQKPLDGADRMIAWNHRLHVDQSSHAHLRLLLVAHARPTIYRSSRSALTELASTPCKDL